MQLSCKPCQRDTITTEATKCCKTCKDPEPLCGACAHRHTLMEANKGHEMTDDLQQCSNTKTNLGYVRKCVNIFFLLHVPTKMINYLSLHIHFHVEINFNFWLMQTYFIVL